MDNGLPVASSDELNIPSEAKRLRLRAHRKARAHYLAAKACDRKHNLLGVPVVVVSAIVGSALFASIAEQPEHSWKLLGGLLSLTAAVLATLQTFFKFSDAAAKHRMSAAEYAALYQACRMLLLQAQHASERERANIVLQLGNLQHKFTELEKQALDVPDRLYDQPVREQSNDKEGV